MEKPWLSYFFTKVTQRECLKSLDGGQIKPRGPQPIFPIPSAQHSELPLPVLLGYRELMTLEPVTLPRILEVSFELLSVAAGVVVLLLALRIAPMMSLSSHRRAMRIFTVGAILIVASEFVGVLESFLNSSTFADAAEEFAELIAISSVGFGLYFMSQAERGEVSSLRRSAETDDLTGLSSRSFFRRAAERRVEFSRSNDLPLVCVLVDVDDFKPYNDHYGHQAGDEALRCLARVLRKSARADDLIGRYGGEEFALLMSSEMREAIGVAERIRRGVECECSPERDTSLNRGITVSLGVAPLTEDTQTWGQLLRAADAAMYRAKRAGKNRASVAP
jgi:two-component system, sensor histidine kinase LadS